MRLEYAHTADVWIPVRVPRPERGYFRRHPNVVAFVMAATAVWLMIWAADLFYGQAVGSGSISDPAVNAMESFAVFAAVPGQVLAALLMWLAARSYLRTPPRAWLVVTLLAVGHLSGIAISAVFASGMLWFAPLLWLSLSPGMLLILLGPAAALGAYFRRASEPTLLRLLSVAFLAVAVGMFAWSVAGYLGGVSSTVL